MSAVKTIKSRFPHAAGARCLERGCELRLDGLKRYVVLKGEKLRPGQKMADCIVLAEQPLHLVAVAELKGRTVHANDILKKLTNASELALEVLEECQASGVPDPLYQLVLAAHRSASEYRVLTSRRVEVRGKKYSVIFKRCGVSLLDVIRSLR